MRRWRPSPPQRPESRGPTERGYAENFVTGTTHERIDNESHPRGVVAESMLGMCPCGAAAETRCPVLPSVRAPSKGPGIANPHEGQTTTRTHTPGTPCA